MKNSEFQKELAGVINKYSKENGSDTPDFMLAHFLSKSLEAFDEATNMRNGWYEMQGDQDVLGEASELERRENLMLEFDDSEGMMVNSALFNLVFRSLLMGHSPYKVIEKLTSIIENLQNDFRNVLQKKPMSIVVETDNFDLLKEILKK